MQRSARRLLIALLGAILSMGPVAAAAAQPETQPARAERDAADHPLVRAARQEVDAAQQNLERSLAEVRNIRADLRAITHRLEVSRDSLLATATKMENQVDELELERRGDEARRKALAEAIDRATVQAKVEVEKDPVVQALQADVKIHQEEVAALQQQLKAGTVDPQALYAARSALAVAQAKLAEREQEAATLGGGAQVAALNKQLQDLSISDQDRAARLQYLDKRLNALREALPALDELDRREEAIRDARVVLEQARSDLFNARVQSGKFSPFSPRFRVQAEPRD